MVGVPNQLLITPVSSECIDAFILTKQRRREIRSFPQGMHVDPLVIKSRTALANATVMSDMCWLMRQRYPSSVWRRLHFI